MRCYSDYNNFFHMYIYIYIYNFFYFYNLYSKMQTQIFSIDLLLHKKKNLKHLIATCKTLKYLLSMGLPMDQHQIII